MCVRIDNRSVTYIPSWYTSRPTLRHSYLVASPQYCRKMRLQVGCCCQPQPMWDPLSCWWLQTPRWLHRCLGRVLHSKEQGLLFWHHRVGGSHCKWHHPWSIARAVPQQRLKIQTVGWVVVSVHYSRNRHGDGTTHNGAALTYLLPSCTYWFCSRGELFY